MRLDGNDQRWEYRVLQMNTAGFLGPNVDLDILRTTLDDAGGQGWELVSVTPIMHGGQTASLLGIMKRRRPD